MINSIPLSRAMDPARILCIIIVLLLSQPSVVVSRLTSSSPPCDFPAIYNFGDSNSDTGEISAAFGPIPPPYGLSFFPRPSGRESDGRLIIDFIAEHLGLPYLSSYLDSIGTNYRHGANFAAEGSTIRRHNDTIFENGLSPFSLDIQTAQFDQFKARTSELYNRVRDPSQRSELPRPQDFSKALYTIDIGQNDLAAAFGKLSKAQIIDGISDIVNQLAAAVINLYQREARSFWIHNTGPIGCLPAATLFIKNPKPGFLDNYGCIKSQNSMAIEFNEQLKARVKRLRKELMGASLVYVDVYSAKYHLISNTKTNGFMEPMEICCGHHENNISVWCGQRTIINGSEILGVSCGSPESYVSWDGINYSQAANQWIANHILDGSFSDPPMPISHACLV